MQDAEEEVENILRDRRSCPLSVSLSFFFLCLIFCFFFRVTRLIKASNSKKSGAGSIRELLLLNQRRFPSWSSLALSVGGESPSLSLSCAFIISPHCIRVSPFFEIRRHTLRIILLIHKASNCLVGATSRRNAPGTQRTRVGDQTMHRHP